MLTKKEIKHYISAIEFVDDQLANKYIPNTELTHSIKILGEDIIKAQEHNLDVPKLHADFQEKINQWVKALASQAKLSEGTIIAKVNIKKQEILKESQGFGFILKSLRNFFSQ